MKNIFGRGERIAGGCNPGAWSMGVADSQVLGGGG